jgi:hypothetical protein
MMGRNRAKATNLYAISKAAMSAQLKSESADYAAAQKPERNQGPMHSGVNQLVRGSQNIVRSGTLKDPFRIG